ncbi:MAG: helix-turn-helix domain-containing protein [Thermoplasmata archaeon]|nr:MAG: helix-turn-helix domain-containing protein [Thermoplasmata archaeon]
MFGLKRFKIRLDYNEYVKPFLKILFEDIDYIIVQQQFTTSIKDFILLCEISWKRGITDPEERLLKLKKDIFAIEDITVIKTDKKRTLCFIKGIHDEMYIELFSFLTKKFHSFLEYPMTAREDFGIITLVGTPKDVTGLMKHMEEFGSGMEIIAVTNYSTRDRGILSVLTEKQLSVLKSAYDQGFFSHPRKTTARKVSKKLGIAHTTFLTHVRKSQNRILAALFEN